MGRARDAEDRNPPRHVVLRRHDVHRVLVRPEQCPAVAEKLRETARVVECHTSYVAYDPQLARPFLDGDAEEVASVFAAVARDLGLADRGLEVDTHEAGSRPRKRRWFGRRR